MSRNWKVVVEESAVEFLLCLRAARRHSLVSFMDQLRESPGIRGDFVERDDTGRELQVKLHREFLITYWADHAAREIRVVSIERAD